jgi:renalase
MNIKIDHLIVGAGISGLTLATELKKKRKSYLILEKSRASGGRMASRRDEDATYDHGAQYFHQAGSFYEYWQQEVDAFKHLWFTNNQREHYSIKSGITQFTKHVAKNLELQLETKLLRLQKIDETYIATCDNGNTYHCENIYITSPIPQTLEILNASNIKYPNYLDHIHYAKALVVLLELNDSLDINYQENVATEIFSISNQNSKLVSKKNNYTIVMSPSWSEINFDIADSDSLNKAIEIICKAVSVSEAQIVKSQLKKWRYSQPLEILPQPYLRLTIAPDLYLLGDVFSSASLNGAVSSALEVATKIKTERL